MKLFAFLFRTPKPAKPLIDLEALKGKTIRVLTCPRSDGADAFAGWTGVVEPLSNNDGMAIVSKDKSALIIADIFFPQLKYEVIA